MIQVKDRLYDAQLFANYLARDNDSLKQLSPAEIFDPRNFGDGSSTSNLFAFNALIGRTYRYMANTILNAGFVQMDNQLSNKLRVVYGLRVEHYDQLVGSTNKNDPRFTNTKVIDYLPGINATYKINPKTNIRVSGSQTVIRPELRELSFLNLYDFELNASVQGKPTLERTKMTNLDLRYELYPRAGETFSIGTFYKYFRTPIEQLFNEGSGGASTFFFQNPEKAIAYGAELEIRKKLDFNEALKHFSVQANASYIHSRVTDAGFKLDRPLQGQSPYVFNAGLMYDLEDKGFSTTLLFNQVGERIYLVGDVSAGAGSPDIYEAPRALLDLQLAKKILKQNGELKVNVSDLLNTTQYFYQNTNSNTKFQKNTDAYRFTRKQGTTFSLNFQYAF
jgi:outer membrane receptor protein involved in Fe transport